jgi:Fe-S-cluster containining protein
MAELYQELNAAEELAADSRVRFCCHAGLACFNQCCQNPTVILKPYDILGLRRRLGMTSTDFLERYTTRVVEDASSLPLVLLDIDRAAGGGCPFLGAAGCSVYEDRPGACRLFPVIQGSQMGKDGIEDSYFCKRLDFCQGFGAGQEWTLGRWKADQGLEACEAQNREWLEIILKRGALAPPADDARGPALFFMAAYDLDRFRRFVFGTPLLQTFEIPPNVAAVLEKSDEELLRFGYKYLKMVLLLADPSQMQEDMRMMPQPPTGVKRGESLPSS